MHDTVKFIQMYRPLTFVLENVAGMEVVTPGERCSALEVLLTNLRALGGYTVCAFKLDASTWVAMSRPRTAEVTSPRHTPSPE